MGKFPKQAEFTIAEQLASRLPLYVKTWYVGGEKEVRFEQGLYDFFQLVKDVTGASGTSDEYDYYTELIKSWAGTKGKRSSVLAAATYYTLHTDKHGLEIALDIDRAIFGETYHDKYDEYVPGGIEYDTSSRIEKESIGQKLGEIGEKIDDGQSIQAETLSSVSGIHEKLDCDRASQVETHAAVKRIADYQARQRDNGIEKSRVQRAWDSVSQELIVPPYQNFIEHNEGHALAEKARAHIDDLGLWQRISQNNPFKVREFILSGPFPALGKHARSQLDLAKETYVEEKVKQVSERMRAFSEPSSVAGWLAMLGLYGLGFFLFWGSLVTIGRTAFDIVSDDKWLFPDAAPHIGVWWEKQLNGSLGHFFEKLSLDIGAWPSGYELGIWIQSIAVFILVTGLLGFILFKFFAEKYTSLELSQNLQIEEIRSYHLEEVKDL